jgi:hypothetical protein
MPVIFWTLLEVSESLDRRANTADETSRAHRQAEASDGRLQLAEALRGRLRFLASPDDGPFNLLDPADRALRV